MIPFGPKSAMQVFDDGYLYGLILSANTIY